MIKILLLLTAALSLAFLLSSSSVTAAEGYVPEPANLECPIATEDSITCFWGPSPVSEFAVESVAKNGNSFVATWAPSQDSRGTISYEVVRDGLLAGTATEPRWTVAGIRKATSVRLCVTPVVSTGQRGPQNCGTFTR